jgi:histidinol-phosphate phosphatase family protein
MVDVAGAPLLERIVTGAALQGFSDFLFLNGHRSDVIEQHFGDGSRFGASIEHVVEAEPLGTAGAFNALRDRLTGPFVVIYGDVLMDVDLAAFVRFAQEQGGVGTLFVHPNDHPFDSDLLETDADGRIIAFHPKPHAEGARYPNLVSAALYVLTPAALEYVPLSGTSDWGRDIFAPLAAAAPLYAYRSCEYVKDIGTPDRLARAERHLIEGRVARLALRNPKPAVFLDRDGVINEERDGIFSPADVALIPGAAGAIRRFNDAGIPVICVTNQPGLAKGMMSWEDLRAVGAEIDSLLAEEAGSYLDDIRVCPHHPEGGWPGEVAGLKIDCTCRKPADGMLRAAAQFHNLDLSKCWLVGDRYCDIAAAQSAGAHSVLVQSGHGGHDRDRFDLEPQFVCDTLREAAELILDHVA